MNFSRLEQLQELDAQTEFDLLIIGGGIVGSAALQMASSAGLKSILLDKNDFASGASSRSTKLLHGGIRSVSYTHLRAHETLRYLVCRLLLEKKK